MAEALLGIRCLNRQSSTARSSSAESMICNRSGRKRSAIFSLGRVRKANMSASSPSNDCPDLLLISTMNRAFDAALPLLATGIADKDRIAEIRVSLSRTLIELISCGVTEYSELLRLALEKLSTSGTAVVRN